MNKMPFGPAGSAVSRTQAIAASTPLPKTLVILGSSSGAGVGASTYFVDPAPVNNYGCPPTSWSGLLKAALTPLGWTVINRSKSSTNTADSLARLATDVAPYRPSHVLCCTGIVNESYNTQTFYENSEELVQRLRGLGAVPILRGVFPHNLISASQYAASLGLNRALQQLGCSVIDHMSILDDGTGKFIGGTAYAPDGQHCNDAGQAAKFAGIDIGIFTRGVNGPKPRTTGSWSIPDGATTETGIDLTQARGLSPNVKSFTIAARLKSRSGLAATRTIFGAFLNGLAGTPLRLRTSSGGFYEIADNLNATLITSTTQPTVDFTVHHVAMTFNHITGLVSLYIDGALYGSAATVTGAPVEASRMSVGGNPNSGALNAANMAYGDINIWNVPLSAGDIGDLYRNVARPNSGLIFAADMSGRPNPNGVAPNLADNGALPVIGPTWASIATI